MAKQAITDQEVERCFDVMVELRGELKRELFLAQVRAMEEEGYRLAFVEIDRVVVAVAGYRMYSNLSMGKHLYVEDLVTADAYRSKGYGEQLLQWLREQAVENDCRVLHLDSGTHRAEAHKFYFRQGLSIASYHFSQPLNNT